MKTIAIPPTSVPPITTISFDSLAVGFWSTLRALLVLALLTTASAAWGAITVDNSSSSGAKHSTRSLLWTHILGTGADRALVVAVSVDDSLPHPADVATVTFNNVAMHAVPGSHASAPGLRILVTQLFYLTGSELPGAGSYPVAVRFNGEVNSAAGGAMSLFGVQPGAPAAVATKTKVPGIGPIVNTINAPANSWVVDIVASESDAALTPGPGQIKRFSAAKDNFGIAGSAEPAAASGPTTLSWDQRGPARLVTSAVAFTARPTFTLTLSTVGSGTIQSSVPAGPHPAGTSITLTAVPAPGWQFAGWSGDLTGTTNPATITLDRNKSITATFTRIFFTLTTATAGSGSITVNPPGNSQPSGTSIMLTAVPAPGWQFSGWSGDLTGTTNPATITLDRNKSIAATFTQIFFTLTTATVGSGSVTVNPPGATQPSGTSITLTAVPAAGWQFAGWSGDLTGTTNPATITLDRNKSVTATFTQIFFTLTTTTVGSGTVTANPPGATQPSGTNITLTAVPAPGWQFSGWSGDLTGTTNPSTITLDSNKSITATFTANPPVITTQPLSQTIVSGTNVSFTVAASSATPLTYQWQKNGSAIPGATAATLSLVNVQDGDAGDYTAVVTNVGGSVTSALATLTVIDAPIISTQPVSQTVTVGANVSFNVVATGTLSYQWAKNGVTIAGATADTLTLSNVQIADAASYVVSVSNSAGTTPSAQATLSVTNPGGVVIMNDTFADGDRTTLAPPNSASWLKAQSSTTVTVAPGSARFTWATTSADMISAFFTNAGSPVTLGVGDSLTLSLTFAFTGLNPAAITAPAPQLRFGVLDSKGTRPPDNASTSNAANIGDTGYALFTSFSTAASGTTAFDLRRRTTTTSNNIFNTNTDFTSVGAGGGGSQAFANSTDYVLTYTITRLSATQTRLTASITGGTLTNYSFSTTETSPTPETTFDYFGWRVASSNFASAITFKNLSVNLGLAQPAITTQPASISTVEFNSVVLTATASGSTPLTFQWNKNGAPIPGATSTTLTLNNVHVADSGAYTFTATNPVGSVTSNAANVLVGLAPVTILVQPASQTILVGEPAIFSVVVSGSAPFAYQWRKDSINIAGATGSSFTIASLQLSDSGAYTVLVSNGAGSVLSDPAVLIVTTTPVAPSITIQPTSATVIAGNPAQFTVKAAGSTPLSYQWSKDGVAIPGATSATFTIGSVAATDAGAYTVTVTNSVSTATSNAAVLTVITPPSIVTPPASQQVNTGETATFSVIASGTAPLSYQWQKNTVNIPGATDTSLVLNSIQAADAGSYSVVVTNTGGSATSTSATLTVADPNLLITTLFPTSASTNMPIDVPLKITFTVPPSVGTAGLIQIRDTSTNAVVDVIDLSAATQTKIIGGTTYNYLSVIVNGNTALITPHVALAYNKTYSVTVDSGVFKTTNGIFPGITSGSAWTFTTKPAPPAAGAATLVVSADGTGDFATVQGAIDFVPTGNTVRRFVFVRQGFYQELVHFNNKPLITIHGEDRKNTTIAYANNSNFNLNARSVVSVDTTDTTMENLSVRNLTPKGGSQAETIRTNGLRFLLRSCDLYSFQDTLQLNGSAFVDSCYIEGDVDFMWGVAAAYFSNSELRDVTSNSFYVQARTLQNQPGFVYVNSRLSGNPGVTGTFLARIDPTVFPFSQVVYINSAMGPQVSPLGWLLNNATSSDTVRFWEYHSTDLSGAPLNVSQRIASSRQITDAEATQLSDPGFVLGGWVPQDLPFIQAGPVSQTISAGQDVVFAVGAFGLPTPTYQWQKDGVAISGATGSTLFLPGVQAGDAGSYSVVVSNTVGAVTSVAATLTVIADAGTPAIVTPPAAQTATIGDTATFSVTAIGSPSLTYQWLKDGVPIAGATDSTLPRATLQLSDGAFYSVTVSNGSGSVTSAPVLLNVHATPILSAITIQTQPVGQTAFAGNTVTFSVVAKGVPPPSYQWLKDSVAIPGANSSTLTLSNVQLADAGSYSVVLTNSQGTVTSNSAVLAVFTQTALITQQPSSQTVNIGATATLTVVAAASGPINYQWQKNGASIAGANASTLTLLNVQSTDTGAYSVFVTNLTNAALSSSAILTVTSPTTQLPPISTFNLQGFATMGPGTTGGGLVDPSDGTHYKVIDSSTPNPAQALQTYLQSSDPLVVEVRTDIDLGVLNNQRNHPLISPELIASGLGVINVASNKTLFSDRGSTLRHGTLSLNGSQNIIVRNLKFRGLWEWDDATQGAYDLQNWDFFTLNNTHNVWIDHCDIAKAYDGQVDIILGSDQVTVSWSRFTGDLETQVPDMINYLEGVFQANPADPRISYYATLRQGGQSVQDIITHEIAQDKTSLVGNSDTAGATDTGKLNVTYHHDAFNLVRQRTPRMRFGNAHVFNLFVDDTASVNHPGTQTAVNSTINAAVLVENSDFLEVRTPLSFSGGGLITQRGSVWQLGGLPQTFNQLNPVNPDALVFNPPTGFTWTDLTKLPYQYTLDPVDYTRNNLDKVGVIVPANATDQALLRSYLPLTVPFTSSTFTLSLSTQGTGTIQSNPPGATQPAGTSIQLTAIPGPSAHFVNWQGDLTGSANPATVLLDSNKNITAVFAQDTEPLTLTTSGSGSIMANPAQASYDAGTSVTLTAVPDPGWQFVGWSGDLTGNTNPSTLLMDAPKSVTANFTAIITPPTIISQPASLMIQAGANASFAVVATGTAPLTYQWQKNGSPIPGANAASLSLVNVQDADAGTYTVVVTNPASSVPSNAAILTVTDIVPSITTPPASQSANTGDTVVFSVVAVGTPPFNYQWRKDGNGLPGANSSTLTLTNVQLADAGEYVVEVSNNAGVATSDPATLTVNVAPVFSLRERFDDGDRTTQNLPASAAWFTSSGSNNLTAVAGQATQIVSSSRTLLAYFTNSAGAPVSLGVNQTLTLDFVGQFSGFDTGAAAGSNTFAVALLRSVANPAAITGTGFVPDGPPNTNPRVSGDFGSNNPASSVFTNYGGYAAFTYTGLAGVATPIKLNARTGTNASLLNSTSPYVQVTGAAATPSVAMVANTDYHGTLILQNTGSGTAITYTLRNAADSSVIMTYSAVQAAASFTQFDTAAFYVSKASTSANYNFVIKSVDVSLSGAVAGDPPAITTQPASQTVPLGGTAAFTVTATGTGTLTYQWLKNGAAITGANAATLSLTNVQVADAGGYRAVVSNAAGSTPSTDAILTVDSGPAPPSITFQPASQTVAIGGNASFTVLASGSAPLSYQWSKDGTPISGATGSTFNVNNAQPTDAGIYSVVVTNPVSSVTSNTATLTVSNTQSSAIYNVAGFAQSTTGGGVLPESDPNYIHVSTPDELVAALANKNAKVIEIMNDLNLGFNEVPATARTGALRSASAPLLHPVLLTTGVSLIDIQDKNGLTIFSANGATIRHANFNVKRAINLIIRNLKFDELWEWDESSKGNFDKQGWDFITVDMNSDNIWIDHCTFTKAYDGVVDIKGGTRNITISWSAFLGDDGSSNSFVRQQINALELNPTAFTMYNFLRTNGFGTEDIIAVEQPQKKGHLVGANELDPANANHRVTLHHNYYFNMEDRMPRLRAGDAHVFNVYIDNTAALAAKRQRNNIVAAMTASSAAKLSSTFSFDVTLNGSISTEGGAVLTEKSQYIGVLFPLRNNQKDATLTQFTGKIQALDTMYTLDQMLFRGDSTTPGSPLAPIPAPEIPFSWNGFTALPYSYSTDDPSHLQSILTGPQGAGAGKLTWSKDNWLKTSY